MLPISWIRRLAVALPWLVASLAASPGIAGVPVPAEPARAVRRPHTELLASEPADGDTLSESPERFRLVFSGPVEEALSEIRLSGPAGLVLSLLVSSDPQTDHALVASSPALTAGAYRVSWRTVSVDGHAVSGSFVFYVRSREPAAGDANAVTGTVEAEPPPAERQFLGIGVPSSLAISRGAAVSSLLALGGLLMMIIWLAPGASRRASALAYLLAFLAPVLLTTHLALWLRSVSPGGVLDLERIPALIGTRAGGLELIRLGLAVASLAVLLFGRHVGSAALLTLLAVLVSGATGHALSTDPALAVPSKAAHLLATQLWLGGLLYLIVEAKDSPEFRQAARRISRIAAIAVLIVASSGILQAIAALPTLGSLVSTTYGRLVLAKAGGLTVLLLFGYRNRFRILPSLEHDRSAGRLRHSVAWETLVMALVFVLAGFLAYVPTGS